MSDLHIGGRVVSRDHAFDHARRYLTDGAGWAYPAYDGYEKQHAGGRLTDADFLAPVLLNISRIKIKTYEALQAQRATLDELLALIPGTYDLAEADLQGLSLLGDIFAVLDGPGVWGAQGTVLAKILHRKRPAFIPLYDERVRSAYVGNEAYPLHRKPGRTWRDFMIGFAEAVQADLIREATFWSDIADLAPGPPITSLRALDIVAWWAGGQPAPRLPQ